MKAVLLLSGGLDSTTTLAIAKKEGYEVTALSFDYGQRHSVELDAARRIAAAYGVEHIVSTIDTELFAGSALTDQIEVPRNQQTDDIPVTYVPARNTVFLSLALALAESIGAWDIFIGVNALDYSGYPDCRPEYIEEFTRLANLATKASIEGRGRFLIHAPLITLTKAEIIQTGLQLSVDYSITHSCYDPTSKGEACGVCDSCRLRGKGFEEVGFEKAMASIEHEENEHANRN